MTFLAAGLLRSLEDMLFQDPAGSKLFNPGDHNRIEAVYLASRGLIHVGFAAERIGCTRRQVYRLIRRMASDGLNGALPRARKTPPINRTSDDRRDYILSIYREVMMGYSVSHAVRVLRDEYSIRISRETLRKFLIHSGLWKPGGKSGKGRTRVHQLRHRLERFGEMLLVDTTFYEWIPGLGLMGLVVFIDDATSRIVHLGFTKTENSLAYMRGMNQYVQEYGLPVSVYADRHAALFGGNQDHNRLEGPVGGDFQRALRELGVACIRSYSPQSRGRVERAHRTIQDLLPKLLVRRAVSNYEQAENYFEDFIDSYNREFAVAPKLPNAANRLVSTDIDMDIVLSLQNRRKIKKNFSFSFKGTEFLIDKADLHNLPGGGFVIIHNHLDGSTKFRSNGNEIYCQELQC